MKIQYKEMLLKYMLVGAYDVSRIEIYIRMTVNVVLHHTLRDVYLFLSKLRLIGSFHNKLWGDKALSVLNVAMLCTADALLLGNCQ